jgi:hypothetical protein
MDDPILKALIQVTILIEFLPLVLLLIVKNKSLAPKNIHRALVLMCLLSVFTDIICYIAAPIFKNNNPINHVYEILSGAVILHIYKLIFTNKKTKKIIQLLLYVFVTFSIFLFFYKDGFKYQPLSTTIKIILLILLSFYYFFTLFNKMEIKNLDVHYFIWINAAFLIYASATFYLFLFHYFHNKYSQSDFDFEIYYWPINLIAMIIFNLVLAKGIWKMKNLS